MFLSELLGINMFLSTHTVYYIFKNDLMKILYDLEIKMNTHCNCTVIARPASYKQQSATPPNLCHEVLNASQHNLIGFKVNTPSHRVHHRLRLLKNLFLHERAVAPCTQRKLGEFKKKNKTLANGSSENFQSDQSQLGILYLLSLKFCCMMKFIKQKKIQHSLLLDIPRVQGIKKLHHIQFILQGPSH